MIPEMVQFNVLFKVLVVVYFLNSRFIAPYEIPFIFARIKSLKNNNPFQAFSKLTLLAPRISESCIKMKINLRIELSVSACFYKITIFPISFFNAKWL